MRPVMNLGVLEAMEADRNQYLFKALAKICLNIGSGVSDTQDNNHASMPVVGIHTIVLAETG